MKKALIFIVVIVIVAFGVHWMLYGGSSQQNTIEPEAMQPAAPLDIPDVLEFDGGRTLMVYSRNGTFEPSTIRLRVGENASVQMMGIEGNHGIEIPAFAISQTLSEGEIALIQIPTNKPGTFEFFCHINCDNSVAGTIVIE